METHRCISNCIYTTILRERISDNNPLGLVSGRETSTLTILSVFFFFLKDISANVEVLLLQKSFFKLLLLRERILYNHPFVFVSRYKTLAIASFSPRRYLSEWKSGSTFL